MATERGSNRFVLLGVAASLGVPSLGLVQAHIGYIGAAAYLPGVYAALVVGTSSLAARARSWLSERRAFFLLAGTFCALIAVFAVVHPMVDETKGDANEALNYAATELLHGRDPYGVKTQLGNVIAPLPGSVLLALPFVVLGDSAYQNFLWLAIFCLFCRRLFGSWRSTLVIFWAIVALSPTVVQSVILGGDRVANSLLVLLLAVFLFGSVKHDGPLGTKTVLAAVLLGIGLSSRANFLFLVPIMVPLLLRLAGVARTVQSLALVAAAFAVVTAPFYFYDPNGFTPTHQFSKLKPAFPLAGELVLVLAGLLAVALAVWSARRVRPGYRDFFAGSAVVQGFLFASAVGLFALQVRDLDATFAFMKEGYGVHFLFFGVLAGFLAFDSPLGRPSRVGRGTTRSKLGLALWSVGRPGSGCWGRRASADLA
jgi:hypothetical protein